MERRAKGVEVGGVQRGVRVKEGNGRRQWGPPSQSEGFGVEKKRVLTNQKTEQYYRLAFNRGGGPGVTSGKATGEKKNRPGRKKKNGRKTCTWA